MTSENILRIDGHESVGFSAYETQKLALTSITKSKCVSATSNSIEKTGKNAKEKYKDFTHILCGFSHLFLIMFFMYYHSSDETSQNGGYFLKSIFLILLCLYSVQFFTLDVNHSVMNNFLHGVNLIFHEAGHVIFSPFGDFITILGGSLGQILMPLIVGVTFFFKERNFFGSAFALWWMGQNFTDVALYISDASARSLPLIGGMSEDAHDWGNLLTMTSMLSYDHTFGIISHYIGMILMLLGIAWGIKICVDNFLHSSKSSE